METGKRELAPGSRSLATSARIQVDLVSAEVQVQAIANAMDSGTWSKPSKIGPDGTNPLRKNGRFHTFRVDLPTGWDKALWMDVYHAPVGGR